MKRRLTKTERTTRRRLLGAAGLAGAGLPLLLSRGTGFGRLDGVLRYLTAAAHHGGEARGDTPAPEMYFIHIFLLGAADGFLAVDPVIGAKATSGAFDPTHISAAFAPTTIPGKSNLVVGLGLQPAVSAFAALPTAFVRGLFIEVTAHPLAEHYNYSGRPSLSETRSYPAVGQVMGNVVGGFPAHVILGTPAPIVDTTTNASPVAPLQASMTEALHLVLDRPGRTLSAAGVTTDVIGDGSFAAAEALLTQLDQGYLVRVGPAAQQSLSDWNTAQGTTGPLYAKNLGAQMIPPAAMLTRYGSTKAGDFGDLLAGVTKTLQAGVCPFVTVSVSGFDTHTNHFALHVPRMQAFATALSAFVADLQAAPAKSGGTMADKTTILISTDFGRTPKLNAAEGTDHFQSGWAIAMGAGIKDDSLVGETDANGAALGWVSGASVARTDATSLLPEHLIATLLRKLGFTTEATAVSEVNLHDLVT